MALNKIRQANKKAKHEARRRSIRRDKIQKQADLKLRQKRMHKMLVDGRRQDLAQRRSAKDYVGQLDAELTNA